MQVCARSSKFSLFDPAKEMAYIQMSRKEKSKGKAAVDLIGSQVKNLCFQEHFMACRRCSYRLFNLIDCIDPTTTSETLCTSASRGHSASSVQHMG